MKRLTKRLGQQHIHITLFYYSHLKWILENENTRLKYDIAAINQVNGDEGNVIGKGRNVTLQHKVGESKLCVTQTLMEWKRISDYWYMILD